MPDGPLCGCGNQGCLHTLAAGSAIVHLARAKARLEHNTLLRDQSNGVPRRLTLEATLDAARKGDLVAREALAESMPHVGVAIADLVNLFDPQMVVIGGPIGQLGEMILEPIRREVRRRVLPDILADVVIVSAVLGDTASAIGAVALFLESLTSIPAVVANKVDPVGTVSSTTEVESAG